MVQRTTEPLPLLAQTFPEVLRPVVAAPVVQAPSQQSSICTSAGGRALDVRLESPLPMGALASYQAAVADMAVGNLATSALVAGRDVAPLGTVFVAGYPEGFQAQPQYLQAQPPQYLQDLQAQPQYLQAQPPQQFYNMAALGGSYDVGTTTTFSYAVGAAMPGTTAAAGSSPPRSLSPPVLRQGAAGSFLEQPAMMASAVQPSRTLVSGLLPNQGAASDYYYSYSQSAESAALLEPTSLMAPDLSVPWQMQQVMSQAPAQVSETLYTMAVAPSLPVAETLYTMAETYPAGSLSGSLSAQPSAVAQQSLMMTESMLSQGSMMTGMPEDWAAMAPVLQPPTGLTVPETPWPVVFSPTPPQLSRDPLAQYDIVG